MVSGRYIACNALTIKVGLPSALLVPVIVLEWLAQGTLVEQVLVDEAVEERSLEEYHK